jgi:hypothetical protein
VDVVTAAQLPDYYDFALRLEAPLEYARRTAPASVPGCDTGEMAYWIARVIDRGGGQVPPPDGLADMAEEAMRFGWVEVQRQALADRMEHARRDADPAWSGY